MSIDTTRDYHAELLGRDDDPDGSITAAMLATYDELTRRGWEPNEASTYVLEQLDDLDPDDLPATWADYEATR